MRVYAGRGAVTQLMLGVVCAAIYGVAPRATSFLPTIPGVTWVRPANMLSELFAVNFGWTGGLGIAFGNSLSCAGSSIRLSCGGSFPSSSSPRP